MNDADPTEIRPDQESLPYFKIEEGVDGNFYPKLIAGNNEPAWRASEGDGYETYRGAEEAIHWLVGVIGSGNYRADF